jgi:lipopolysaccharide export LptBFGC system permease protein LptF
MDVSAEEYLNWGRTRLRVELKKRGLSPSGLKTELLARLEEYFKRQKASGGGAGHHLSLNNNHHNYNHHGSYSNNNNNNNSNRHSHGHGHQRSSPSSSSAPAAGGHSQQQPLLPKQHHSKQLLDLFHHQLQQQQQSEAAALGYVAQTTPFTLSSFSIHFVSLSMLGERAGAAVLFVAVFFMVVVKFLLLPRGLA